ncbi:hypothetical protein JKF63_03010 [Porcisia hertigi]|uniref:Uncharacterized protein n=1 Tax=Porcisia hertigi TaxID=2761500 RepID=A0A836I5J1_9TRYP|nr:hypothetical protein JKF63_03010 [Porcisia hertigi]
MNEDSGGGNDDKGVLAAEHMSSSSYWQLTPEEEAALLSEYGVELPYDNGVEWTAPSHFKSQMGDGHVFLTGAATDDEVHDFDDAADARRGGDLTASGIRRQLGYKDPLRLYLQQNFPSLMMLNRSMPLSLVETISDTVDALESRKSVDGSGRELDQHMCRPPPDGFGSPHTLAQHAAVLRSGKEWVRRACFAVQGASSTAMASQLFVPETHEASVALCDDGSLMDAASVSAQPADIEFCRLIESTQQLLEKATEALCARSGDGGASEAEEIAQVVRELEEREALLTEDALDAYYAKEELRSGNDDVDDIMQLIRRAREGRARLHAALTLNPFETPAYDAQTESEVAVPEPSCDVTEIDSTFLSAHVPVLPKIYAFEMELPRSDPVNVQSLPESSGAVLRGPEEEPATLGGVPAVSGVEGLPFGSSTAEGKLTSFPELIDQNTEILALIASTEIRDAEVQRAAAASRETCIRRVFSACAAGNGAAHAKSQSRDRNALGLAMLPTFVQQLDVLLSPTREEREYRGNARASSVSEPDAEGGCGDTVQATPVRCSGASGGPGPSVSVVNSPLEQIRRRAALESFLVAREAAERRQMRIEDELVEREIRVSADRVAWYVEQRTALERAALQAVESLRESQGAAYEELLAAACRDRALAQQSQELRCLQETEKLVYTLLVEWEVQREQLLQDEALALRLLHRDSKEEEQHARAATERRLDDEMAAARKAMEHLRTIFEQQRQVTGSGSPRDGSGAPEADTALPPFEHALRTSPWFCGRIAPLLKERGELTRWAVTRRRALENVRALLVEAETQYRDHVKAPAQSSNSTMPPPSVMTLPETPPLVEERAFAQDSAAAGTAVLNADTFVRLLWPSLNAAVRHPRRAPQFLAKLILSLEDLFQVDWAGLRQMRLSAPTTTETHHEPHATVEVPVTSLVRELDISGNPLQIFDVLDAVRTFSSLQSLSVSNAQLHTLEASDTGVDTAKRVPSTESLDKSLCSVAREASSHSLHLRHVTAARNNALAKRVRLLSLDVSSNNLGSLAPLGRIASSSLVSCKATQNKLSTLDSLLGCVQLRELSAAHNRLTDVEAICAMPVLRELDVRSNKLATLTGGSKGSQDDPSSNSLLLLSRLHASHNPLRELPSKGHVYACLTQLFVNHTELTTLDASSIGWCPVLTVLQAEGNQISDISGLQHCSRLQSLKLSHNRIASLSSLEPLRCCTRLRVLDLTGNPCLAVDGTDTHRAATVQRLLCDLVPSLEDLNNTRLMNGFGEGYMPEPQGTSGEALTRIRIECGEPDHSGFAAFFKTSSRCVSTAPQLYQEVFSALCWDWHIQRVLEEKEMREAYAQRPLNRAKGWEITAVAAAANAPRANDGSQPRFSRGATAIAELNGVTAAQSHVRTAVHQRHVEHCRVDVATVDEWLALSHDVAPVALATPAGHEPLANMHVRHPYYERRQQDHIESLARAYLAEWLLARTLIRRARLELYRLRVAFQQSEAHRREIAARRIQPVWRGAALRSRLQRFLHPGQVSHHEVEVDEFHKVDVDEWLLENDAALVPVEVLLHNVVGSARNVAAVPFDIPAMAAAPAVTEITSAPSPPTTTTFTPLPPSDVRPSSGVNRSRLGVQRNTDALPSADTAEDIKPNTSVATLNEQWGPLVAGQIRKRQQKSSRAHQERMRKEFLQDPLRIKREVREDRAQQRLH